MVLFSFEITQRVKEGERERERKREGAPQLYLQEEEKSTKKEDTLFPSFFEQLEKKQDPLSLSKFVIPCLSFLMLLFVFYFSNIVHLRCPRISYREKM